MSRRVLLLMRTRTYRAAAFLVAAERLGLAVTVGTEREQPLGGGTVALDFGDERRLVRQVSDLRVDAVVGVDDDTTVQAAQVARALGLAHNSVESVKAARYKDVMRLALSEADVLSPGFTTVALDEDPRQVAARMRYPCVLKPLALSASRGVIRADDEAPVRGGVRGDRGRSCARPSRPANQILVEDFIPGAEVALEGLLQTGKLTTLALFDKPDPLDGPYFEETIYVTPSRKAAAVQADVARVTEQAALALGLQTGPVHAELRLNERGAWIVEVAARSIGGLCSKMLRFGEDISSGGDHPAPGGRARADERDARAAAERGNDDPDPARGRPARAVSGVAEAEAVPGVDEVDISIPCGEKVVPLPRATRYLGFIFAHGDTPETGGASATRATPPGALSFDIRP